MREKMRARACVERGGFNYVQRMPKNANTSNKQIMADTNTLLPCHTNVIMNAEDDVADHGPPHDLKAVSMKEEEEETFHAKSCGGNRGK